MRSEVEFHSREELNQFFETWFDEDLERVTLALEADGSVTVLKSLRRDLPPTFPARKPSVPPAHARRTPWVREPLSRSRSGRKRLEGYDLL
ncbi:MAG TPA: hypothetical protein PKK12_03635 [Candidatus Aminicenantes bacterium]|nr:hypothetical protein [Candidatus Aminicenantes bacterium]